jgi:hypothetical protein
MGRYFDNELPERIAQCDPHIILVPSIWPETYCYVLSGALRSGRRIAVFDLGAQADRTRRHDPQHLLLPLSLIDQPQALVETLLQAAQLESAERADLMDVIEVNGYAEVRRHGR